MKTEVVHWGETLEALKRVEFYCKEMQRDQDENYATRALKLVIANDILRLIQGDRDE